MTTITAVEALDIRFPTSRSLDGSDAMNPDPDYSAAYVIVRTDDEAATGHGFTFTIGRGNEICVAAIEALRPLVVGRSLEDVFADMGAFWRSLVGDSQLRWIGPEKGAIHLATAAVVNAVWDLYAKREGKPLWKLLVDLSPEEIVACVDFRYLTDALTHDEALELLRPNVSTKGEREAEMRRDGFPAYTTSVGWLGYPDEKVRRLCCDAVAEGWTQFKMKVGANLEDDVRRAALLRQEIGPDRKLMMDANQAWDVGQAIANMRRLAEFDPWWIEEPTSPDDVLGHAAIARALAPIRVATGEHVHKGDRRAPARRKVRRAGLPARRRSGALRIRATPFALRLHRGERRPDRPRDRVRGPPPRALRLAGRHARRPLHATRGSRLQRGDEARLARGTPLFRRP